MELPVRSRRFPFSFPIGRVVVFVCHSGYRRDPPARLFPPLPPPSNRPRLFLIENPGRLSLCSFQTLTPLPSLVGMSEDNALLVAPPRIQVYFPNRRPNFQASLPRKKKITPFFGGWKAPPPTPFPAMEKKSFPYFPLCFPSNRPKLLFLSTLNLHSLGPLMEDRPLCFPPFPPFIP